MEFRRAFTRHEPWRAGGLSPRETLPDVSRDIGLRLAGRSASGGRLACTGGGEYARL